MEDVRQWDLGRGVRRVRSEQEMQVIEVARSSPLNDIVKCSRKSKSRKVRGNRKLGGLLGGKWKGGKKKKKVCWNRRNLSSQEEKRTKKLHNKKQMRRGKEEARCMYVRMMYVGM